MDDTTFNYVCLNKTQRGEFMMTCTNYLLVYAPLYEAGFKTEGGAASTDYGTGVYTTVSSGPYRISYIEDGALMTLVRNPAWYGWETDQDGAFVSHTVHTVNGEHVLRFNATRKKAERIDPRSLLYTGTIRLYPSTEMTPYSVLEN